MDVFTDGIFKVPLSPEHFIYSILFPIIGLPRFSTGKHRTPLHRTAMVATFLKKIATYYFCEFKRRIYETIWGEGDRVEREISKGFPHPKISSTVPILSTANFLSLYPPSLSPYLSIIHPPSSSNILSLSLSLFALYYFQKFHQLQVTLS